MKIQNTTDWPDYFLRRLVSWVCRELGLPMRFVKQAKFRNRRTKVFSGHAYHYCGGGRIVVSIGPERMFPFRDKPLTRSKIERHMTDRIECLVNITAHELRHLTPELTGEKTRGAGKWRGSSERATEHDAQIVLEAFRRNRDVLLAIWNDPPKREVKAKISRQEKNEARARKALAAWERKLKLAKTKVSNYRRKVRYYDRIAATSAAQRQERVIIAPSGSPDACG